MTHNPQPIPPVFHIDVSASPARAAAPPPASFESPEVVHLLRHLVTVQDRQTKLLEELVQLMTAAQRQRTAELGQWRQANPGLVRECRNAAHALSEVQTQFLRNLTEEVNENAEALLEGDFLLTEFVDRYGPRLAHLNGVLQMLAQLSTPTAAGASQEHP
jgi:phage-related tail protein